MVVPLFGWSAGDIVVSIRILYRVGEAFRETGGAKDHYEETATWLDSFAHDIERIRDYVGGNESAKYTENIKQQIANIDPHYVQFEKHLQKYDTTLSSKSTLNVIKTAFAKVRWTMKELKGQVDGLKTAVGGPLMSINLLFSLQTLHNLDQLSQLSVGLTPLNVDRIQRSTTNLGAHVQSLEHGLVDLQKSLYDHTISLQSPPLSLTNDASTNHQRLLDEQSNMLVATRTAIAEHRSWAHKTLDDLKGHLDAFDQRIVGLPRTSESAFEDLKLSVQACQIHLGSIQNMVEQLNEQTCPPMSEDTAYDWQPTLNLAGSFVGGFMGVASMLAAQRGVTRKDLLQRKGKGKQKFKEKDKLGNQETPEDNMAPELGYYESSGSSSVEGRVHYSSRKEYRSAAIPASQTQRHTVADSYNALRGDLQRPAKQISGWPAVTNTLEDVWSQSGPSNRLRTSESALDTSQKTRMCFYFSIKSIVPNYEVQQPRYTNSTNRVWIPPTNFDCTDDTDWKICDEGVVGQVPRPGKQSIERYTTTSLIWCEDRMAFLHVRRNCLEESIDYTNAVLGTWKELSFYHPNQKDNSSSLVGYGCESNNPGPLCLLIPEFIPAVYLNEDSSTTVDDLAGDLATVLGLVAFSAPPGKMLTTIATYFGGTSLRSTQNPDKPPGAERIDKRGMVIQIGLHPRHTMSRGELDAWQNGRCRPTIPPHSAAPDLATGQDRSKTSKTRY